MSHLEDTPSLHKFPQNIARESAENKKKYFDDAFGKFIDKFLLQKVNANDFYNGDYVMNYALCCIFLAVLVMQMKDTTAEGDGTRNLLLSVFKSMGAYSKNIIEMYVSIAPNGCLLTPRLSEQFKWGCFVNWRSGVGINIDLAQEISNRCSKSIIERQGPNKTLNSISKVCKATTGIYQIVQEFDLSVGIHKTSVEHTTHDSLKDEKEMVHDLLQLNPFHYMSARCHDSFPGIKRSPLMYMNFMSGWINT